MAMTKQTQSLLFTRKQLVQLMVPLVIEQFLLMTVGMADTMMVSASGEAVVSGVSLVDNINILIINIFSALSTGGAVVVSQYLGHQDQEKAQMASKQLLYVSVLVSVVLMTAGLVFRVHILRFLFGDLSAEIMASALIYFLLTAAAYPFIAVYNAGAALFRAMGNSQVSMFNSVIVNIVNIVVNAILIFQFHMGAAGAGIGTLVSRIVAAVIIVVMITRPSHTICIQRIFHPELRWSMVKTILSIGIPNGIENSMFQIGKLLVLGLVTSFDKVVDIAVVGSAVAANAITSSIAGVINVPGQSTGLALITVVGRCMGAGDNQQAVMYTKKLLTVEYLVMGVMNLILFFSAPQLALLFNLTPATAVVATQVLQWNSVFNALIWPLAFALPNALRAAGDARFTMLVSMVSMWVCRIGFSYLLGASWGMNLGLLGVWQGMFIDWIVRAIAFTVRFARGKWKEHRVI